MNLSLLNNTVEFGEDITFESFTLTEIRYKNCSEKYTLGMFPCQEIRFVLQRQLGYFIIQVIAMRLFSLLVRKCVNNVITNDIEELQAVSTK